MELQRKTNVKNWDAKQILESHNDKLHFFFSDFSLYLEWVNSIDDIL